MHCDHGKEEHRGLLGGGGGDYSGKEGFPEEVCNYEIPCSVRTVCWCTACNGNTRKCSHLI